MIKEKHIGMVFTALIVFTFTACRPPVPQLGKSSLDEVIAAMTLEEKAHFVIGTGMKGLSGDSTVIGETQSIVPGAAGTTCPIPRLGIPAVVLADGPAGLRIAAMRENDTATYYCTHFPIGTLLASTWDKELVEHVGRAIGNEALEYGADILLAPALNIHRNPLCGRNFEYYSEDPVVSGEIAVAYVRGVQSNGVGTSIKHFAVNNQESNRKFNDAHVSQRALREIYLKGFEKAVTEADPWTVMSSYNYLNGIYTSENKELLTVLLRDEWGFNGLVMTDWYGGSDAIAQMMAGNDMLQPGTKKQYDMIIDGLKSGKLNENDLDKNVKRLLELILKTPRFKGYKYSNKPDLKAHAQITRQSATEGMILLKNNMHTLPFSNDIKNIALFGCTSYDYIAGGTGSGNVNRAYTVSLLDGLSNAGYTLDETLKENYEQYTSDFKKRSQPVKDKLGSLLPITYPEELLIPIEELRRVADRTDIALITLGRTSGEFADRTREDFNLKQSEKRMLEDVCALFHELGKKVVVVLNIGGVIETASWKHLPDAILLSWQAGQEGGNSVTDILSGKASPSGKLTISFPVRYEDVSSASNFPIVDATADMNLAIKGIKKDKQKDWDYTNYEEDIYVGYRYFDTFNKEVSYPFGYGLSYTTFEYTNPKVKCEDECFIITVNIVNNGSHEGKEVVQLYTSAPRSNILSKPEKELKDFAKTITLKPGEKTTVTLKVEKSDLASYDEATHSWIVEAGTYQLKLGTSSKDIKVSLDVDVAAKTTPVNDILKPQVTFNRLSY